MVANLNIPIQLLDNTISLKIFSEKDNTAFEISKIDAEEFGESIYQISEGCFYDFEISNTNYTLEPSEIVSIRKAHPYLGRISPNIYVGSLTLNVISINSRSSVGKVVLEVRSTKTSYREDYRVMLAGITERCTELIMQYNSLVNQTFTVNFEVDSKTLYQRFAFIKSILDSNDFYNAIHKIINNPIVTWMDNESYKDIRGIKRFNTRIIRQITSSQNKISLSEEHLLYNKINSIPAKVNTRCKTESVDTPENRFVKYALIVFSSFINDFKTAIKKETRIKLEATQLETKLEEFLSNSIFKEISDPSILPLNSPVLQRKEGYRDILRTWLMFDLAASLFWKGGDDVYEAGKKDVAVLYEYWLFFKLIDLISEIFNIESKSIEDLIQKTADGLGLQLKQGKHVALQGIFNSEYRKLNIEFSYNRTFKGKSNYPAGGSWTRDLRPDYTLSIWPYGVNQKEAEEQELIVHIHFDAKYKIEKLLEVFQESNYYEEGNITNSLDVEKEELSKGNYKRIDLLKMHTYRDAIRRTAGAYIIYPGNQKYEQKGFHEILPGLGAFAVSPSKNDSGINELKAFLKDVINHFLNRASQREKLSFRTYDIYKEKPENELRDYIPETYGQNRNLIPDETFVLVGYYKTAEQLKWIENNKLYNFRTGTNKGSLPLGSKQLSSKYIVLHGPKETKTTRIFELENYGPKIFSKEDLKKKHYPSEPSGSLYLMFSIKDDVSDNFNNPIWDLTKLKDFKNFRLSAIPIVISLSEFMSCKVNINNPTAPPPSF